MLKVRKSVLCFSVITLLILAGEVEAQIIPYDSELIEEAYAREITARREREEASFRNKETTLLSDEYFKNFSGLNYYPVNLKYRVVGQLHRLPQSEKMNLDLTDGSPYGFMYYGKLSFFLEGQPVELKVFEFPSHPGSGPTAIFVPFTDMTTGVENFGGGRFLIIKIPEGEQIVVDFNLAINPICVYDPEHACPVSPPANYIPQKIQAGAKMYYDKGE